MANAKFHRKDASSALSARYRISLVPYSCFYHPQILLTSSLSVLLNAVPAAASGVSAWVQRFLDLDSIHPGIRWSCASGAVRLQALSDLSMMCASTPEFYGIRQNQIALATWASARCQRVFELHRHKRSHRL